MIVESEAAWKERKVTEIARAIANAVSASTEDAEWAITMLRRTAEVTSETADGIRAMLKERANAAV
jgi:hypothetical protein